MILKKSTNKHHH